MDIKLIVFAGVAGLCGILMGSSNVPKPIAFVIAIIVAFGLALAIYG